MVISLRLLMLEIFSCILGGGGGGGGVGWLVKGQRRLPLEFLLSNISAYSVKWKVFFFVQFFFFWFFFFSTLFFNKKEAKLLKRAY